jgi:peptide chain release factor subunit 1
MPGTYAARAGRSSGQGAASGSGGTTDGDAATGAYDPCAVQASDIDRTRIRRLAKLHSPREDVVSLYLDLNPASAKRPRARRTQLDSLLGAVEQLDVGGAGGTHEQRAALNATLARIRDFFAENGLAAGSARGLAVFCSEGAGLLDAYRLPRPVKAQVRVGDAPSVEPLLELAPTGKWVVLLVSRRAARLFRGSAESLEEVDAVQDDVHRRHSQGGWSQARFQRGIEKETLDHVKRACELTLHFHEREPVEHLVVGGPEEIWPIVDARLHAYLRELLVGHIEADVERSSAEEVLARAAPLMTEVDRWEERELLDRLAAGLGTGDEAVAGLVEVRAALRDRRVEVLLVLEDLSALEEIELALGQSAEVRVIHHHPDELRERGSIAALLRY